MYEFTKGLVGGVVSWGPSSRAPTHIFILGANASRNVGGTRFDLTTGLSRTGVRI